MTEAMKALSAWIEARAVRHIETGCLVWKLAGAHGGKEPQGRYLGKIIRVRREVLETRKGKPLSQSVTIGCRCETPMCVEETHLVTRKRVGRKGQKWTMADRAKIAKATRASSRAKLTEEAVADIRKKEGPREMYVQRYGIAQEYVSDIQGYRAWRDYGNVFAGLGARS